MPPPPAVAVIKTLCIMWSVPPVKVGTGKDKVDDYWAAGKSNVLDAKLLQRC